MLVIDAAGAAVRDVLHRFLGKEGFPALSALGCQGVKREGDQCPGYSWSKIMR